MYIQEIWITLLVVVAFSPLGQRDAFSSADQDLSTLNATREDTAINEEDVLGVVPLEPSDRFPTKTPELPDAMQRQTELKKKPLLSGIALESKNQNDSKLSKSRDYKMPMMADDSIPARARALNMTASVPPSTNSLYINQTDLSDVSMDDEDKEMEGGEYIASYNETHQARPLLRSASCVDSNQTYAVGETIVRGCEEECICGENGTVKECKPLCTSPYIRRGRDDNHDPSCHEKKVEKNHCCAILVCAHDSINTKPEESCLLGNKTLSRGEQVHDGCSRTCVCEVGGSLKCQPRCPPNDTTSQMNHHDRCVALTDPRDPCCTITYCDVSLGEHEIKSENPMDLAVNVVDVKVLNSTAIKLKLSSELPKEAAIQVSEDNHSWTQKNLEKGGVITNLEPAHSYYVRIKEGNRTGSALRVIMPAEVIKTNLSVCNHRGKQYKVGEEWYDECIALCMCGEGGKTECLTLECPTDFGLDVLNPHCLDWETVPLNFIPKAPKCCPEEVRCRNNGSCVYEDKTYDNWSEIPSNVTGCEKRCYCEIGKISCQAACPPVPALPPSTLSCSANQAVLAHLPNDDCCSHWVCDDTAHSTSGMNTTSAYVGPLAIDTNNWRPIDNSENPTTNNKSIIQAKPPAKPSQDVSSHTSQNENTVSSPHSMTPATLFHYPMDPGHPTLPYNGPFNLDYKPTDPKIDQMPQSPSDQYKPEKTPSKDKSKSKTDMKKPIEPGKIIPHKDVIHQTTFPGPLAPDKFPLIPNQINMNNNENPPSINPNTLSSSQGTKGAEQPQFISLNKPDTSSLSFTFSPSNGENIPPTKFNPNQFDHADVGPPYIRGSPQLEAHDPNYIATNTKKKNPLVKPGSTKPKQEMFPEELLHLINLHHPGLSHQLDPHSPINAGHPGLYKIHQQISNQREPPANKIPVGYYGVAIPSKNHGETIYHHIDTSEVPSSPQQIEELLAHISQHDPNPGPFQHYPDRPPIIHNYGLSAPSSHTDDALAGVPSHLNNPFTVQAPNKSDMQEHNFPGGFPLVGNIPGYNGQINGQVASNEIVIKALDALDDRTVRLIFTVPPVLVGLHGRVELRYTSDQKNMDPSTWRSQVFIPPNDLIATPQLEFELDGLEPDTEYKLRVTVNLRDIGNSPSSKIYRVVTLKKHIEQTTLPPQISINAELRVVETNSTSVNVMWKKFTEYEMQFIDGVQLRYKERDGKVYATTPLIHRAVTNYVIENLKPANIYEIGISIIPFPGQTTELISEQTVQIVTTVESDPYAFDVKVEIKTVKSQDIEISWTGVPYPEDKYVNIYRAIYQSDSGKGDTSTFKIAKRDSSVKTIISDLKPGTRYRLWLEIYLTNGRIKKSNVQDFVTKPGVVLSSGISQGKLASIPLHEGDYYGPLVIVAIVASLAILSTLILLMMLMKRRSSSKADISPRKTTSAYDNPSYKTCEDVVTITNGGNKVTEHEMSNINSASNNIKDNNNA